MNYIRSGVQSITSETNYTYLITDTDQRIVYYFIRTLKISAILRCCGREQWFSMDKMTGMSELTNADRLTASTTS